MRGQLQRGDTIIEVLLAITVFSLIAVGAMTIMSQGTNTVQRSLETALVKQQVEAQAEALRAAYQQELALHSSGSSGNPTWNFIKSRADMSAVAVGASCPTNYGNGFILNARTASEHNAMIQPMDGTAPPYAQVTYDTGNALQDSYGIWIEKQTSSDFDPQVYTFRVRACWYGPGLDAPMQVQTVVRLYEAT